MPGNEDASRLPADGVVDRLIRFCLEHKVVVALVTAMVLVLGAMNAPFDWDAAKLGLPRDPVPVDAIPDIGENQQIVFTQWEGRSPQDVEDQVTYPLTVSLLGIPGVKTVRSFSMFGFSSIYIIFDEDVEFYWSRTRLLEKLNSLPPGALPPGVSPVLGPDATALGQVFWYTIEGRDPEGNPTGGWDLDELRSAQDFYVRYALMGVEGVSEAAGVGGFVREYQIDVDPDAMRLAGVALEDVIRAVKLSNKDVGARTIEINRVEYVIRGVGFIKTMADIEEVVVREAEGQPIRVRDVARVVKGPALRRGVLDKGGAEAVGGVVVVRYGENPLDVIKRVKAKLAEIAPGMPSKVLADGTVSTLAVVPFYDRTGLIHETLDTLREALTLQVLVTVIVVLLAVMHLKSSLMISALLPMAVLMCFIAMRRFGVDANIVALSGIAIAIGAMVDMGVVISENILRKVQEADAAAQAAVGSRLRIIYDATLEVGGAVLTAVATTVISFLPVFAMEGAEGKLFKPLAFTKTYALLASVAVALVVLPPLAHWLLSRRRERLGRVSRYVGAGLLAGLGVYTAVEVNVWLGALLVYLGLNRALRHLLPGRAAKRLGRAENALVIGCMTVLLADTWLPLGPERGLAPNLALVVLMVGGLFGALQLFQWAYPWLLARALRHKALFLLAPFTVCLLGGVAWLGAAPLLGWLPQSLRASAPVVALAHAFPGLGREFMPPLDEGSFLYMPTTMPHASIGEVADTLSKQDMAFAAVPEVAEAVGKLGRADTPLDPAPVSMIETVVNYKPEYLLDAHGDRQTFRFDPDKDDLWRDVAGDELPAGDGLPYYVKGRFARDADNRLIPDPKGKPFRLWRPALDPTLNEGRATWPGIQDPDDIWQAVVEAGEIPGVTSAPRLQPIAARIVMLQSGMRAPMGIKVKGPDLETIEAVGMRLESLLKEVPSVQPAAVIADRIVGKPYLEVVVDREAIARYGVKLEEVQDVIEAAVGGRAVTTTVEGRERYPVRVRYMRELRDSPEALMDILVAAPGGEQIPLKQLARLRFVRGPQVIKSEDTFLVGYVLFDKKKGFAEVDVVEAARDYLEGKRASGELVLPEGVSYSFAGSYENQARAQKKLAVVLPLALASIFIILYLQFRRLSTTLMVFSGIAVAWSGGFILLWLYGQAWFLDFSLFGQNLRELFQMGPVNLSVAVWVGFLALFGIATDDGVLMVTYLDGEMGARRFSSKDEVREAVLAGAMRRIRPAMMTSATTILALLPVLTSTGRGSDIMGPMAIPSFGGMLMAILTVFVAPVLYCWVAEREVDSV